MRISTNVMQLNSLNSMLEQQSKLHNTQLQLASGKRILTPSDDPTASALSVDLNQSKQQFSQFQDNGSYAKSRLSMEDTSLATSVNILQRVRELAVQGASDNYDAVQRQNLAVEVRQRLGEILGIGNTKDANGDYLFSGGKGATIPFGVKGSQVVGGLTYNVYGYDGDQVQRQIQVGPERRIADSDHGYDAFINLRDANGAQMDVFSMIDEMAVALENDVMTAKHIEDMDNAIIRMTQIRASVGARLNALDTQETVNSDFLLRIEETMSDMHDLDYAEAITRLNTEMAGLESAQKAYGKVQGLSLFNYL
jgi:flagellar hook-associated protein 3 FlgL